MFPEVSVLGYAPKIRERRAHHRRRVNQEAELVIPSEGLTVPCLLLNISEGGAGITCDIIPRARTRIRLVLKDGQAFDGITIWFEDGQLGLKFVGDSDR